MDVLAVGAAGADDEHGAAFAATGGAGGHGDGGGGGELDSVGGRDKSLDGFRGVLIFV